MVQHRPSSTQERVAALSESRKRLLLQRLRGPDSRHSIQNRSNGRLIAFVAKKGADTVAPDAAELKQYLGKYLPHYMIPSEFVVLDRLARLPNGKIDRTTLLRQAGSARNQRRRSAASSSEEASVGLIIQKIWIDVLQIDEVSPDDNFFELGGDSILSINVVSRAKQQGIELKPSDLFDFPTLAELTAYLDEENNESQGDVSIDEKLRSKNTEGTLKPFFMVHGGSRLLTQLRSSLQTEQPIHLLPAHWDSGDIDLSVSIESLAAAGLELLREKQPHGPYVLGGYSVGCVIALEMAQVLRRNGEEVEMLFMLDPPESRAYFRHVPRMPESDRASTKSAGRLQRQIRQLQSLPLQERPVFLLKKIQGHLGHYLSRAPKAIRYRQALRYRRRGEAVPEHIRKLYVGKVYLRACRRYEVRSFDRPLLVFRGTQGMHKKGADLWQAVANGGLTVNEYPCEHLDLQRDPEIVAQWTRQFARYLQDGSDLAQSGLTANRS